MSEDECEELRERLFSKTFPAHVPGEDGFAQEVRQRREMLARFLAICDASQIDALLSQAAGEHGGGQGLPRGELFTVEGFAHSWFDELWFVLIGRGGRRRAGIIAKIKALELGPYMEMAFEEFYDWRGPTGHGEHLRKEQPIQWLGGDLRKLVALQALEQLRIERHGFESLDGLAQLSRLRQLDLGQSHIKGRAPRHLVVEHQHLERLVMPGVEVFEGKLPRLQHLSLGPGYRAERFALRGDFARLEVIELRERVGSIELEGLRELPALRVLNLPVERMQRLPPLPPSLETLTITRNRSVDRLEGLDALPQLRELTLDVWGAQGLPALPPHLERLCLRGADYLPEDALDDLPEGMEIVE